MKVKLEDKNGHSLQSSPDTTSREKKISKKKGKKTASNFLLTTYRMIEVI